MQLCICHHYLLLASAIIAELDSIFDVLKKSRRKSICDQCLAWHVFATCHSICLEFHHHLCMSFQSFQKLVGLLNDSLLVDQEMASLRGGAIIPELCVYITLQYLAGGSYTDIFFLIGISQSSFFIYYGRQLIESLLVFGVVFCSISAVTRTTFEDLSSVASISNSVATAAAISKVLTISMTSSSCRLL